MSNENFQKKFDIAFRKLTDALENLENTAIDKLHETSLHSSVLSISGDEHSIKGRIVEQNAIIQNLNDEINKLQKNILTITAENENLTTQNESLLKKINQLRSDSADLIDDIESDLIKISKIIEEKCQ
ncbi:MAG: hypothetical protein KGQ36_01430 [Rickettsiales bacterium]|nr:hypothetical protein [Rickettsiales bacterium]